MGRFIWWEGVGTGESSFPGGNVDRGGQPTLRTGQKRNGRAAATNQRQMGVWPATI
jgi:hypothetical protein